MENAAITVEKLCIKDHQRKVSWHYKLEKKNDTVIIYKYHKNGWYNMDFVFLIIFVGMSGENVRTKKKDSPPKSSSKTRQGSNRKKVSIFGNSKQ